MHYIRNGWGKTLALRGNIWDSNRKFLLTSQLWLALTRSLLLTPGPTNRSVRTAKKKRKPRWLKKIKIKWHETERVQISHHGIQIEPLLTMAHFYFLALGFLSANEERGKDELRPIYLHLAPGHLTMGYSNGRLVRPIWHQHLHHAFPTSLEELVSLFS